MILGGKPLIAWSIDAAGHSDLIDRTVVSTDDKEIAAVAAQYGGDVPFPRPQHLATDTASVEDAVIYTLDHVEEDYDYVVALQATSPFRRGQDIDSCITACWAYEADACMTVVRVEKSPYWMMEIGAAGEITPVVRDRSLFGKPSQALPAVFQPNGAVYVAKSDYLRKTKKFGGPHARAVPMPIERSIDIDTEIDFELAKILLSRQTP